MVGERLTTLGEAADLLTGYPFQSARFTNDSSHMRLLRGDNIAQGNIRWENARRWPSDNCPSEYVLQPGDVILAMDRPWIAAGLKRATLTEADCPSLLVQRVARLRARRGLDQRFLGYVIQSAGFTNYVLGVQTGTTIPHISGGQIKAYSFHLPPLPYQQAASDLLGALNDKIELNRGMAETLEAAARTLFRSWFVDFDPVRCKAEGGPAGLPDEVSALFPDSFSDDGLPNGWSRAPLGEFFDVVGGNTPRTAESSYWDGPHQWATPKDLSDLRSPVLLQTSRTLTDAGLAVSTSGLLPGGSLLLSSRAPIGYMAFATEPTAINQGFAGIVRKGVAPSYAWAWLDWNMDAVRASAGGSTFPEISKTTLRTLPMLRPSDHVLAAFTAAVDPMVDRIVVAAQQSRALADLRDTLLPRLISSELRVADAEREAVAA